MSVPDAHLEGIKLFTALKIVLADRCLSGYFTAYCVAVSRVFRLYCE